MLMQYPKALFSLLKNSPVAITLFTSLVSLQKKYRLNPWFLWLPYVKPQTRVFLEWLNKYSFRKQKILEIGCGVCSLDVALSNKGFKDIVCIDLRRLYLKASKELLGENREQALIRADANLLPFRSQIFDVAAMIDLSYFKGINLKMCFNEISRLLKPKGTFIADFYEGSEREDVKRKYYLVGNVVQLAKACSFHLMRFLPIYHPGDSFAYGYIIMVRKDQ
jgi:ubiquinone/menaquinone biosynthesis C-methylase UbiE